MHDELTPLVEAGLMNADGSNQSATRNPAHYLGRLADLGTVEPRGEKPDASLTVADQ